MSICIGRELTKWVVNRGDDLYSISTQVQFKKNNVNFDTKPMIDYVDDSFTDVLKSVIGIVEKLNFIRCYLYYGEIKTKLF